MATKIYHDIDTDSLIIQDSVWVELFNEKGQTTRRDDREGICYQNYVYDDSFRLLEENNYCGEGYSECKSTYKDKKRFTDCVTNYHITSSIDSIDANGKIIWSETNLAEHDNGLGDSAYHNYYKSQYHYDKKGREIKREDFNKKGGKYYELNRMYNGDGLMTLFISYNNQMLTDDSISYTYDSANRLIRIDQYDYFMANRKPGRHVEIRITYHKGKIPREISTTNDTLFSKMVPYFLYYSDVKNSSSPESVIYKYTDYLKGEAIVEQEHDYTFQYDENGRLISADAVTISYINNLLKTESKYEIIYPDKNEAVLQSIGKNYLNKWAAGSSYHYKNNILVKEVENTEHGFPDIEKNYHYEYYSK